MSQLSWKQNTVFIGWHRLEGNLATTRTERVINDCISHSKNSPESSDGLTKVDIAV